MANEYNNKITLATGEVLMDLTQDDITPENVDSGIKFHDRTGAPKVGTSTKTVDASGATATAAEVLDGSTFGKGNKVETGTMPNNSGKNVEVTDKEGAVIPRGYYDGASKAVLSDANYQLLKPENLKAGVTILNVTGTYGPEDMTSQSKAVAPTFEKQIITPDDGISFLTSVEVEAIKVTRTDNEFGGVSVVIG